MKDDESEKRKSTEAVIEKRLAQAVNALEHERDFSLALSYALEAEQMAIQNGYLRLASEAVTQQGRIHWRLYTEAKADDPQKSTYAKLAEEEALEGVVYAEQSKEAINLPIPHVFLGSIYENTERLSLAIQSYQIATANPLPLNHHPSFREEIAVRLHIAEYKAGQKTTDKKDPIQEALLALERLRDYKDPTDAQVKIDPYAQAVWLSGGYMKIADAILSQKDYAKGALAQQCIQIASTIIESNNQLELRKRDLERLKEKYAVELEEKN